MAQKQILLMNMAFSSAISLSLGGNSTKLYFTRSHGSKNAVFLLFYFSRKKVWTYHRKYSHDWTDRKRTLGEINGVCHRQRHIAGKSKIFARNLLNISNLTIFTAGIRKFDERPELTIMVSFFSTRSQIFGDPSAPSPSTDFNEILLIDRPSMPPHPNAL